MLRTFLVQFQEASYESFVQNHCQGPHEDKSKPTFKSFKTFLFILKSSGDTTLI